MPIATQKTPENESRGCLVNCSQGRRGGRVSKRCLTFSPKLSKWLWPCGFSNTHSTTVLFTSLEKRKNSGSMPFAPFCWIGGYFKNKRVQSGAAVEAKNVLIVLWGLYWMSCVALGDPKHSAETGSLLGRGREGQSTPYIAVLWWPSLYTVRIPREGLRGDQDSNMWRIWPGRNTFAWKFWNDN